MAYTTIDDPSAYFQTTLFTGNDSARDITNDGNSDLQPDLIWLKGRSHAYNHGLFDSSRGVQKELQSNTTSAENTLTAGVSAFNSDGFSFNGANYNTNAYTFVAWQWKSNGGTTASNSDGTITSTVQANTTAGFSIVTYTGNGSNSTIGHGLGATPKIVIVKRRTGSIFFWAFQHASIFDSNDTILSLNTSDAAFNQSGGNFNGTNPTSSVFSIGSGGNTNGNTETHVAYCFAEKQGYSKFGSYTGNGNVDGPFIYTGFKPAWFMIKRTDAAGFWTIFDNKRGPLNEIVNSLDANVSNAEETGTSINDVDFLSNGIKIREDNGDLNASSGNIIYMAFAESPFVSSEGVPTTAR